MATPTATTTTQPVQTPSQQVQAPTQTAPLSIPADYDQELKEFVQTIVTNKDAASFVKKGIEELNDIHMKNHEIEKKKYEEIIKNFLLGEQQIKSLYSSPEESMLVNKAYDNVKNDMSNISSESLNTAILTVKACMASTGNLTKQEEMFQKQVSTAISEQGYPVKKSKIEEMMDFQKPKPFSINPEIIKTIASSAEKPQVASNPNELMKPTKPTLEQVMQNLQRFHYH